MGVSRVASARSRRTTRELFIQSATSQIRNCLPVFWPYGLRDDQRVERRYSQDENGSCPSRDDLYGRTRTGPAAKAHLVRSTAAAASAGKPPTSRKCRVQLAEETRTWGSKQPEFRSMWVVT